jgi:hypothetical protein
MMMPRNDGLEINQSCWRGDLAAAAAHSERSAEKKEKRKEEGREDLGSFSS